MESCWRNSKNKKGGNSRAMYLLASWRSDNYYVIPPWSWMPLASKHLKNHPWTQGVLRTPLPTRRVSKRDVVALPARSAWETPRDVRRRWFQWSTDRNTRTRRSSTCSENIDQNFKWDHSTNPAAIHLWLIKYVPFRMWNISIHLTS